MTVYLVSHLALLILGLFYESVNSSTLLKGQNKKLGISFYVVPSFILLFIISTFRGSFNADYNSYVDLFHLYNQFDVKQALQITDIESGYILLNKFLGIFTNDSIYLFLVVTLIILICYYSQFIKHSPYVWLSVLMFVTIGSFYSSFNIMRQILAVAIIFAGSKYLYERKFIKYFLVVILATSIHTTSIIMIAFYFILNLRFNLKNIILIFVVTIIVTFSLDSIISFVRTNFYSTYNYDAYGMTGAALSSILLPISLLLFCFFNYKKIDLNNNIQRIWINGVIFYAVFSILTLQVFMVSRLTHFFSPFALLLIPTLFSKIKSKEIRIIAMMILVALLITYNYIVFSGTDFDPYNFIWDAL